MYCDQCGAHNRDDAQFCNRCGHDMHEQRAQLRGVGASSSSMPETGDVIGNRYEVQKEIGRGGMGIVYRAHDRELDLPVALKVLHPRVADRPEAVSQLREEALAAMRLTHPNIVRLYNFEKRSDATYLLMEYVPGQSMAQMLNNGLADDFSEREVVELVRQLCDGLNAAHKAGVIHRDIKPSNLLMTPTGGLKIVDFGIARAQGMGGGPRGSTRSVGTPTYMAPEQYQGAPVDARTDIYAIGTTVYEILAGHPPFVGGDLKQKHLEEEPEPIVDVSDWLNAVVLKCLAKNPKDRWQSVEDLAAALTGKEHPALAGLLMQKETDRDPEWRRVARERNRREQMLREERKNPRAADEADDVTPQDVEIAAAIKTPAPPTPIKVARPLAPVPQTPSTTPGVDTPLTPSLPVASAAAGRSGGATGSRRYTRKRYERPKAFEELSTFIWPPSPGVLQFGVGGAMIAAIIALVFTFAYRANPSGPPGMLSQLAVLAALGLFWGLAELRKQYLLGLLTAGVVAGVFAGTVHLGIGITPDSGPLDMFVLELARAVVAGIGLGAGLGFARRSGLAAILAIALGTMFACLGAGLLLVLRAQDWLPSPYADAWVSVFAFALLVSLGGALGASVVRSTNPMRL